MGGCYFQIYASAMIFKKEEKMYIVDADYKHGLIKNYNYILQGYFYLGYLYEK